MANTAQRDDYRKDSPEPGRRFAAGRRSGTVTGANQPPQGFEVMRRPCETCIYRPDSPLDLERLENQVRDPFVGFKGYRVCHHHDTACCRGFWERYKDEFQLGQLAQRLDAVVFVEPAK